MIAWNRNCFHIRCYFCYMQRWWSLIDIQGQYWPNHKMIILNSLYSFPVMYLNNSREDSRLVPDIGCLFLPNFGQAEAESFVTTIRWWFDENISNYFYIHINVGVILLISLFWWVFFSLLYVYNMWCTLSSDFWFVHTMFLLYAYIYLSFLNIKIVI